MTPHLQPLSSEQHIGLGLRPAPDWDFCQALDVVPIALSEFADVVTSYPIIFSVGPVPQALAVLGLGQGKNDFLDADRQWPAHQYVPAILKLHPFCMGVSPAPANQAIVMLDASSPRVVPLEDDDAAQPLFTFDGKPSPTLAPLIQKLGTHAASLKETGAFIHALSQAQLLADVRADIQLPDGSMHQTRSFRCVNASAFRQLQEPELSAWFRQGWTDAVALHLASLRRWTVLFERRQARGVMPGGEV
ncbi:MAG: SapC family protein [Ottowia sp.]|uniref:SapC family protein n=1 Tax=Ottowia sp. TaxID=1898956 RepID=UPI003C75FB04